MIRTPVRPGTARPVMSFEEAMTNALNKPNTGNNPITKWDVEVYFRVPFEGQSAYKSDYKPIPLEQFMAAGIPNNPVGDAYIAPRVPFEGCSTTHAHYPPHPINPDITRNVGGDVYVPPRVPFEGVSTTHSHYPPHPIVPDATRATAGDVYVPPRVPFEGCSTTHAHYPPHPIIPDTTRRTVGDAYVPPRVPFEGVSTTHADYPPHPINPDVLRTPGANDYPRTPHVPFEGVSSYKAAYKAPDMSLVSTPAQPNFDDASDRGQPRVPFEGSSTSKDHYKAPPLSAYQREAPSPGMPNVGNPRVPFEGRTTNQETYIKHQMPAREEVMFDALPVQMMKDDRDWVTTAKDAFKAPPQVLNDSITLMQDRHGRLRVYVDRNASVADLQKVLEDYTCIPMPAQHIVRRADNMVLETHETAKLVQNLNWNSGEEIILTDKEREAKKLQGA